MADKDLDELLDGKSVARAFDVGPAGLRIERAGPRVACAEANREGESSEVCFAWEY